MNNEWTQERLGKIITKIMQTANDLYVKAENDEPAKVVDTCNISSNLVDLFGCMQPWFNPVIPGTSEYDNEIGTLNGYIKVYVLNDLADNTVAVCNSKSNTKIELTIDFANSTITHSKPQKYTPGVKFEF